MRADFQPFVQTFDGPFIGPRAFIIIIIIFFIIKLSAVNRGAEGSWELFTCLYLKLLIRERTLAVDHVWIHFF